MVFLEALEVAKRELRCLLVLLYSAEHDDMAAFCDSTMADDQVLDFLREKRFVVWAGDVRESEAFVVSNTLLATTYPFLALIAPQGTGRMVVVERFEGPVGSEALVGELRRQMDRVDAILQSVRLERERVDQSRILREQQEEAYNASLRADQEKARKLQEEVARMEKEKAEEGIRQKELENKRENKRIRKIWLQENMIPEPPTNETEDIAKVGIRLPNGDRLDLYDFIEAQDLTPIDLEADFEVINTYPRKVLTDKTISIKEAGLFPTSSVMVEEVD
ncbi:FAS-associated factor 2 [Entophlyctis luteolus]|nr:FAS-associated factor 2 [Entophlyctis luteolus]